MIKKKELIKTSVWTLLMAHLLEYWLSTQSLREAWKPGDGSGFADCQVWNFLCWAGFSLLPCIVWSFLFEIKQSLAGALLGDLPVNDFPGSGHVTIRLYNCLSLIASPSSQCVCPFCAAQFAIFVPVLQHRKESRLLTGWACCKPRCCVHRGCLGCLSIFICRAHHRPRAAAATACHGINAALIRPISFN